MGDVKTKNQFQQEINELQQRLDEATDAIEAIRTGQVDALVVHNQKGPQLYTLKNSDHSYRIFIEKMNEGAVTLNEKGIILYSNSSFAEMMNLPLTKIIGSYFEIFVTEEHRKTFHKIFKAGWEKEIKSEISLLTSDNKQVPFLISLTTLDLDEGKDLSMILTDLTIQKNTEKELKEKNEQLLEAQKFSARLNNDLESKVKERTKELLKSREHFKFLADTIPVIIWTALPNGEYDYFNKQWYNYTGKTFDESKGKGWQSVIHPEDLKTSVTAWNRSVQSGEPFKTEDRKLSTDGEYRWHLEHALPFKDDEGNIIAWFGVCTDIEEQKRDMKKKDEFIIMASHELKTPVTSLKAFTQLLSMMQSGNGSNVATGMLEKMDRQINKLTSLITDLLDASKANTGKLNFHIENFDFNELVKEVVEEMQRTSLTHTLQLQLAQTQIINGDRNRVAQVIINLLSNAIKYSPHAEKVLITSSTGSKDVRLCVQDFGIGIPESQHSKLFTRFFRVTNKKTDTYPGLGLGLYICNEIIKRHAGTIDFKSEDGKGSTFCFSLPVKYD